MKIAALAAVVAVALAVAVVPALAGTFPTSKTAQQIHAYYDSGDWSKVVAKQAKRARLWINERTRARNAPRKPALVLDIDDTSLNNYPCLDAGGGIPYNGGVYAGCVVAYDAPAIRNVRSLFNRARHLNMHIFFITGRPDALREGTLKNLRDAGYKGEYELIMRPPDETANSAVPYKKGARKRIQRRGYKIIANVGDQRSDLKGGYSERTYYLPNLVYFTE